MATSVCVVVPVRLCQTSVSPTARVGSSMGKSAPAPQAPRASNAVRRE